MGNKTMSKKGGNVQGVFATFILIFSTSMLFVPVFFIGLCKLFPIKTWQDKCTRAIDSFVALWCSINSFFINRLIQLKWEITGFDQLDRNEWYLVVANHQSWLDIVILQHLFNRKIPTLKFFIKNSLKWVPLLGFSWWAMGCPFMKRYSKAYLAKKPHKQGKDLQSTYKAIEKFKRTPASIMNFVEGTRFNSNKREQQNSPYTHLLKPKAGGISFIISTMGQQISSLLDVTIVYGEQNHSLWDFLCNRVNSIKIIIRRLPVPTQFLSSTLISDQKIQEEFKHWLNHQWTEKDNLIASLK